MAPAAIDLRRLTRRVSLTVLLIAGGAFAAGPASAQQVITTAIGDPEIIAVTVEPASNTTYFATDRPGAIYRLTSAGAVLVAGVAGGPTGDGVVAAQAAVFPGRNGLAIDQTGNIFFSEPNLHRIRRIDSSTVTIATVAGTGSPGGSDPKQLGGAAIGTALAAPGALAFNPATGDLFVADETWDIVYRVVSGGSPITNSNGTVVRAVGGDPSSVAIFVDGLWYNPFGYGGDGGPAIDAKLNHPRGLAFDSAGNLYIADTGNNVVRRVDTTNTITTFAGTSTPGSGGDGQVAATAQLFMPTGLDINSAGDIIIADTSNHRVRSISAATGIITTVAGTGLAGHSGDGAGATRASLAFPTGVAFDGAGNLLIADSQNNRVRSVSAGQTISTIAQRGPDYSGDGLPGGNGVNQPQYVTLDAGGNLFFSDSGNSRIRRRDASTGILTTVAGSGIPGYDGDSGPAVAARLNCPAGITFGPSGELYVADPCAEVVRRIDAGADGLVTGAADEIITTYAGNGIGRGTQDGDFGPATAASLNAPFSLVNHFGFLYIGEPAIQIIRTVDFGGNLGTYALGIGSRGFTENPTGGSPFVADDVRQHAVLCGFAQLFTFSNFGGGAIQWSGLSLDALGGLFVSEDNATHRVFDVFAADGTPICFSDAGVVVTPIAGNGSPGYSGDGGPADAAALNHPAGTVLAGTTLYIADSGNNVIRQTMPPVGAVSLDVTNHDFGTLGINVTSQTLVVTAKSTGTGTATFTPASLIGSDPGDFTIISDGCAGATLANGQTCQVAVAFRPTQIGARSATLQFNNNVSGPPQTVVLTGTGATLSITPPEVDLGSQALGITSSAASVTVTNSASPTVILGTLSITGSNPTDFAIQTDGCSGATLGPQASCTFTVTFTPQGVGLRSGSVSIPSTGADGARSVVLTGNGLAIAPAATAFPTFVPFGQVGVGNSSSTVQIVLTSTGTAPLNVAGATLGGNQPRDFAVTASTCNGAALAPGQTCAVTVVFKPAEVCHSSAVLSFTDNASDSPQTVDLSGDAVAGATGPFQPLLFCTSFAAQPQDVVAGADGSVWFDEAGSAFAPPAIGRAIAPAGVVSEDPTVVTPGWKPSGLVFAPDGSHAYLEARGAGFPLWLDIVNGAGLKFRSEDDIAGPVAVGPDRGFWLTNQVSCADVPVVTDFAPTATTTGYTPTPQWLAANTGNHSCLWPVSITTGPDGSVWIGTTNQAPFITPRSPKGFLRVSPEGVFVDFTATDGAPMATTIGSDGNLYALVQTLNNACTLERFDTNVNATPVALDPSVLALSCSAITTGVDRRIWIVGETITGASLQMLLVAFDPGSGSSTTYPVSSLAMNVSHLASGPDEGIWFNSVPSAIGRFDLGGGTARAHVAPSIIAFDSSTGATPASLTVQSTGTTALSISSVALTGPDAARFAIVTNGCSGQNILPGASCVVTVQPTGTGNHTASLVIGDNDAFSPQIIQVSEFALPPQPAITPAHPSFPNTLVGQHTPATTFTLTNPRDTSLSVSSVVVGGANPGDFLVQTDQCSSTTVLPGGSCTVTLWFAPSAAGPRNATLTFTDAANPPTQTATLTGTGQSSGGTGACACSTTSRFLDPTVVPPATTGAGYFLKVTVGGSPLKPIQFDIAKLSAPGTNILTFVPPIDATWPTPDANHPDNLAFGFSPDGNRFAVHYQSANEDVIDLFDLTSATPSAHVWEGRFLINDQSTGVIPSGSFGFSPGGQYLVATQIETFVTPPSSQQALLRVVSSSGTVVYTNQWKLITTVAEPDEGEFVESSHWGFAPDDRSLVFLRDTSTGPLLSLIALPSGAVVQAITFTSSLATYVQFSPCGDVLGVVDQFTDPTNVSPPNPVTITLYSTRTPGGALGTRGGLPAGSVTMKAGPSEFTADVDGWPGTINLAPNTGAAGCASPTTTGSAGGSSSGSTAAPAAAPLNASASPVSPARSALLARAVTSAGATTTAATTASLPPPTVLLLPNGRGTIQLPADVTPALSTFTYTETDGASVPLNGLRSVGLDFTLVGADAASGSPIGTFVDPPIAQLVFRDEELRAARIPDATQVALFWWSGAAWINQLPCAGCGVDITSHTLTALLTQPGEYVLAAGPPSAPVLTITATPISVTVGTVFAGTVASFPPANPGDRLNQYAAVINWGDGQVSPAVIAASGSVFIVPGSHTWAALGTYTVSVTVFDDAVFKTVQTTATVTPVPAAPQFTAAAPPLTATQGVSYSYGFTASGFPAPTFALAPGAPSWLSIGPTTGTVSGTPPSGTTSFSYSVVASNGVSPNAVAGPFTVAVAAAANKTADLAVTIGAPATATRGATIAYTIVVKNNGPSAAADSALALVVGPGATFVSATPAPAINAAGLWVWRFGTLNAGATATVTLRLRSTKPATLIAVGTVASDTPDPKFGNNVAVVSTTVK